MTISHNLHGKDLDAYPVPGPSNERSPLLRGGPSSSAQPLEAVPGYEELERDSPPEFHPYHAEHVTTPSGDIYSHDHHLNEDGEALYRFLLSHAEDPPNFLLKCRGIHVETGVRQVYRVKSVNGQMVVVTGTETYTETVTDFDFTIDISRHLRQYPSVMWTVPDDEPTYRGGTKQERQAGFGERNEKIGDYHLG
ncbi:hypothetical protein FRC11_002281 [Ceratobasidium sp. 423]|nr:hypothetical protein FRC11_002281 [Ceratobasidium sp. 423]